jgi:DNA-binding response OmpR family regulator
VGLHVLLVDDDVDFTDQLTDSLRDDGHEVRVARDGASAMVLARELQPDVILLDLGLPDADGYDVARTLRREVPGTTPIIVVTGRREAPFADDVDLLLNKPVPAELFGGLLRYLCRRRMSRVAKTLR